MRLVAATAPPGLEPSAPPSIDQIPNNHRAYAVQWFLFALIAGVIYVLAVRKRLQGLSRDAAHDPGQWLARGQSEMPGYATAAVGLYARAGREASRRALSGIAHLFEHMVFKGAGGRSARAISEAIEDVGGELNACTEREGTALPPA